MKLWIILASFLFAAACSHSKTASDSKSAPSASSAKAKAEEKAAPAAKEAKGKSKKSKKSDDSETKTETAATAGDHTTCKSAGDERVLSIISKDGGCAVEYTKHAEKKEIASAQHETEHCKQVVQKVKGHLEAAGYTCN